MAKAQENVDALDEIYDDFFAAARENGIIWVQSAGNHGYDTTVHNRPKVVVAQGDAMPSNRGGRDSEIIVVGAAMPDGTYHPNSSPVGVHIDGVLVQDVNDPRIAAADNPSLGWTDAYAVGDDVRTCYNVDARIKKRSGTSVAAAQVVSLQPFALSPSLYNYVLNSN